MSASVESGKRRRTWLDPIRLHYQRRLTTQSGAEIIIRARRKIDAETTDPLDVSLPLIIVAPWAMAREIANHRKYEHRWIVELFPRWDSSKAQVLADLSKSDALARVDREAEERRRRA